MRRLRRKYWKHGKNHTFNQIVLEPGSYKCFSHNGKNYIEVFSLTRGKRIAIPIRTNYSITGQIKLRGCFGKNEKSFSENEKDSLKNQLKVRSHRT